jgi:hypothetical protein
MSSAASATILYAYGACACRQSITQSSSHELLFEVYALHTSDSSSTCAVCMGGTFSLRELNQLVVAVVVVVVVLCYGDTHKQGVSVLGGAIASTRDSAKLTNHSAKVQVHRCEQLCVNAICSRSEGCISMWHELSQVAYCYRGVRAGRNKHIMLRSSYESERATFYTSVWQF